MASGFSVDHLMSVFRTKPKGTEFVIRVRHQMYVVNDITADKITVQKLNGLKIDQEQIITDPPKNVVFYWYFPFTKNQLILGQPKADDEPEEKESEKKTKKKSPRRVG